VSINKTIQSTKATSSPESAAYQSTNQLINFLLHLSDNNLVLSQRNSAWCGHGPVLEQDIAITNISLDMLGQARNTYQYAAELINLPDKQEGQSINQPVNQSTNQPATEDSLAYLRTEREFCNCLLVELPNGDWGHTVLRQYLFSQFQGLLYGQLQHHADEQLAAMAAKALKEITYHIRWSSEWVIRLGDGTEESHGRMVQALEALWPYTGELFEPANYEQASGVDYAALQNTWQQQVAAVLQEATLPLPTNVFMQSGGKKGVHTEHLGYLLAEMQYLQRTYPGNEW
jgi:ring-1,2-phenylacetyl-CoA epoxidase subunit PaaC